METTVRLGADSAGGSGIVYRLSPAANASPSDHGARVYAMPAWARHGTQPNYWTAEWARKERLADWDRLPGSTYESDDMEDVIRRLNEDAGAA